MPFDVQAFLQARLELPTETVPVPDLKPWFGPDEKPEWTIRALTGNELALVQEAENAYRGNAGVGEDIRRELLTLLGKSKDTQPAHAKRVAILRLGTVSPECSEECASRLGEKYGVLFLDLVQKIMALTGRGAEPEKKPSSSGQTPKPEPQST